MFFYKNVNKRVYLRIKYKHDIHLGYTAVLLRGVLKIIQTIQYI